MKSGSKLIPQLISLEYKNTMKSIQDHVDPEDKKQPNEFFPELGLKKSQDIDINMTKNNQKNSFLN